jgi:DNA adenine methylase
MLPALRRVRPKSFVNYHEPFCGGLAHFIDLWSPDMAGRASLSDANEELIRAYAAVARSPEAVLAAAIRRLESHSEESFLRARAERIDDMDDVAVAARMLYLNRTSYNALYRVDWRGRFSVGMGHDRSGDLRRRIDADNLRAVARMLAGADLRCCDFCAVLAVAKAGDFVFIDPPYPGTCCDYTPFGFTRGDHRRLRDVCAELDRIGAMWLQTNRDCAIVRELYGAYRAVGASVYRRAGNPSGARVAKELIITNYSQGEERMIPTARWKSSRPAQGTESRQGRDARGTSAPGERREQDGQEGETVGKEGDGADGAADASGATAGIRQTEGRQGEAGMEAVLPAQEVQRAVKRASVAAISADAQDSITRACDETMGCVRIVADGDAIRFESVAPRFASGHVVEVGGGACVTGKGQACVRAGDLKRLCSKLLGDAEAVSLAFRPRARDEKDSDGLGPVPNGALEVGVVMGDMVVSSATIDSYAADGLASEDYPAPSSLKTVLRGRAGAMRDLCKAVEPAVDDVAVRPLFDMVAAYERNGAVCLAATDGRTCALAEAASGDFDAVGIPGGSAPLLIPARHLMSILASAGASDVLTVASDEEGGRLYVYCGDSRFRLSYTSEELRATFPDCMKLAGIEIGATMLVGRAELTRALDAVKLVNPTRCRCSVSGGGLTVAGRHDDPAKGAAASISLAVSGGRLTGDASFAMRTRDALECVRRLKGRDIRISVAADGKKLKIEEEGDSRAAYFMGLMHE